MKNYVLKAKIDSRADICYYLSVHAFLLNAKKADYCLVVDDTHYIYKFETEDNVWYIHHDPTADKVFRVCVYERKD